jgi:MFS transporter, DHA1 family, multidrug resistance protein
MTSLVAQLPPRPGMGEKEFVALMALLQALQALAIDIMLPALGVISADLGVTDPNQRQLVVAVFLICAGLGSLFPGSFADRYGRRPVLFTSLAAYVLFSFGAALVTSFTALLVLRGLAGFVASGMLVMSGAIIRDRFDGDKMARMQSLVSMVFMIVPMIAPTLGQAVLLVAGWRAVFVVMALLGAAVWVWAWLRLPETLHPEYRQAVNIGAILSNMRVALTNRTAFGYVFGMALIQGALFGYINSSQQLIAEQFGAGVGFPLIFGAMALVMSGAAFTNSRIVVRFGARRVSHAAVFVYIGAAAAQLWLAMSGRESLASFAVLMTLNLVMMAFIGGNFQSIALQPFARMAGAAASLQSFIRVLTAAILGTIIGQAYDGTARPLALSLLVAGVATLALVLFSERGKLFRRLNRPGAPPVPAQ